MKKICPCCGCRTLQGEKYEICPVCFWENAPDCAGGGANSVGIEKARENYKSFGASEERFTDKVRKPYGSELSDMRRKDREMSDEYAFGVFDRCEYAVLAMTDEDGKPYCIPFSPARDGDTLYFHCACEGKKIRSLRKDPSVCVTCAADTENAKDKFTVYYGSAVIRGTAIEVLSDKEKIHALKLICEKYTPENMDSFSAAIEKSLAVTAVWKIDITDISGKRKSRPGKKEGN